MGVDALTEVDTGQGGVDLRVVRSRLGGRVCAMGGMNAAITLGPGSSAVDIQKALGEPIGVLAPGEGFILHPVEQIFKDARWRNVLALIECWWRMADYPIAIPPSIHP